MFHNFFPSPVFLFQSFPELVVNKTKMEEAERRDDTWFCLCCLVPQFESGCAWTGDSLPAFRWGAYLLLFSYLSPSLPSVAPLGITSMPPSPAPPPLINTWWLTIILAPDVQGRTLLVSQSEVGGEPSDRVPRGRRPSAATRTWRLHQGDAAAFRAHQEHCTHQLPENIWKFEAFMEHLHEHSQNLFKTKFKNYIQQLVFFK